MSSHRRTDKAQRRCRMVPIYGFLIVYEQANFYSFKWHQHTQGPPPPPAHIPPPANLKATQRKNNSNDTNLSPIVKTYLIPTYLSLLPIYIHILQDSSNYTPPPTPKLPHKKTFVTNICLPDVTLDRKKTNENTRSYQAS